MPSFLPATQGLVCLLGRISPLVSLLLPPLTPRAFFPSCNTRPGVFVGQNISSGVFALTPIDSPCLLSFLQHRAWCVCWAEYLLWCLCSYPHWLPVPSFLPATQGPVCLLGRISPLVTLLLPPLTPRAFFPSCNTGPGVFVGQNISSGDFALTPIDSPCLLSFLQHRARCVCWAEYLLWCLCSYPHWLPVPSFLPSTTCSYSAWVVGIHVYTCMCLVLYIVGLPI